MLISDNDVLVRPLEVVNAISISLNDGQPAPGLGVEKRAA
jgi:hypothetical protein